MKRFAILGVLLFAAMFVFGNVANTSNRAEAQGLPLVDLVFVIDVTGSMRDDIDSVKTSATEITSAIFDRADARVALVTYKDHGDDFVTNVNSDYTTDEAALLAAIDALGASGGGDFPEAVYSGLIEACSLATRDGAERTIILLGDAPASDPEDVTGYTLTDVEAACEVFSIVVGSSTSAAESFAEISARTGGTSTSTTDATTVVDTILGVIDSVIDDADDGIDDGTDDTVDTPDPGDACGGIIPAGSVVGQLSADVELYWAPAKKTEPTVTIPAPKTLWVVGLDSTGDWTQVVWECQLLWIETGTVGPNFDNVWNGAPLPTRVVQ